MSRICQCLFGVITTALMATYQLVAKHYFQLFPGTRFKNTNQNAKRGIHICRVQTRAKVSLTFWLPYCTMCYYFKSRSGKKENKTKALRCTSHKTTNWLWFCSHLANNPARHTHPVKNGDVDDGGHASIVDGLRAVRPHVGTLCQVDVARRQTREETKKENSGASPK